MVRKGIYRGDSEKHSRAMLARHIEQALTGMRSGSIEVVVHEGRVVQIERKERFFQQRHDPANQSTPHETASK